MKRIKVVTGYAAHARFMAELVEEPIGEIPRDPAIPSPFAYSPVHVVWQRGEQRVVIVETRHARHEVFEVPAEAALSPIGEGG